MTIAHGGDAGGSDFSVKPVLLVGERAPGGLHPLVAVEDRLTEGALRKMRAVLGIFAEDLGLLHGFLPCLVGARKETYADEARLQRSSNEGSVTVGRFTFRNKVATGCMIHLSFSWWSGSNICIPARQALLQMLESKNHQKI